MYRVFTSYNLSTMRQFLLSLFLVAFFAASLSTANAQVPRTFSYQGVVMDATGHFITDGAHNIRLKLYDAFGAPTEIYSENQLGVVFVKGLFNVMIGSVTPIPTTIAFDRGYFLGVSVDGGAEMAPRTALSAAPYAIHAMVADRLAPGAAGVVTSVNTQDGAITLQGGGGTTITNTGGAFTISSSGGGGTGIQGVQNGDASIAVTNPNGPTATISVANNGITAAKISANAVGTASIVDGAVTPAKLNIGGSTNGQILTSNGTSASWQNAVGGGFVLPFTSTLNSASDLFTANNGGAGSAIVGIQSSLTSTTEGVLGQSNSTAVGAMGVYGLISSASPGANSIAVRGENKSTTSDGIGVWGSQAGTGLGVYGTTPNGIGIYGNGSSSGTGVYGTSDKGYPGLFVINNTANTNNALTASTAGTGGAGYFEVTNTSPTAPALEVKTASTASTTLGIYSLVTSSTTGASNVAAAIEGEHAGTNGVGSGVWGKHNGTGAGVFGSVSGNGGYGVSASAFGAGSTAMLASYSGGANAGNVLELNNGYIKVSGANKTAYIHITTANNVAGNKTTLNYPGMAVSDILIVTHNFVAVFLKGGYGVAWNGNAWTIYNEDNTLNMPINEKFNILVIKQ